MHSIKPETPTLNIPWPSQVLQNQNQQLPSIALRSPSMADTSSIQSPTRSSPSVGSHSPATRSYHRSQTDEPTKPNCSSNIARSPSLAIRSNWNMRPITSPNWSAGDSTSSVSSSVGRH
ncbi:hypothetical protein PGTUg99_016762 [Puccinia graminis f. sp. tritici]|uniref:Uncharacterized protein n=1 Tax=Puccinia graminis f. sp. tritici TaxID=56615 RepID=A0A5B0S5L5_PUCGR|nr:hypothetical protein PGTUg99_016762 [Puccinia graminis f. sp. tritici]